MDENETQVEETTEDTPEASEQSTQEKPDKPVETPEARLARLERQAAQLRKKLGKDGEEKPAPKPDTKESSDLDWGQRAFLKASGINGADELQLVKEYVKRTGDSLDAVIEDDIFKARLEKLRTTKANELAAGTGSRRGTATSGSMTPEYWVAKLGPNDQVPSDLPRELRQKVVELRRAQGKNAKMFYND